MKEREAISLVLRFNECINTRDLTGLAEMMTDDHTFIDSSGETHKGREKMTLGWFDFFKDYPDYRNNFTQIFIQGDLVVMVGFSECSHESLDGPAIWTAKLRDGFVSEWRVYLDTEEVRSQFGL